MFHPVIILAVFGVLLWHIILSTSKVTPDILILTLSVLYFFVGLISIIFEYSVIHYRGHTLM